MIKIKLSEVLGREKMTRKRLSELTGIRPNTIGDFYKGNVKKIDIEHLDLICKALNCELKDLIEYVSDND